MADQPHIKDQLLSTAAVGGLATAAAVALPEGEAPEWVKLFPYGTWHGRDGRGPYRIADQAHGQKIVAATAAYQKGADAPVDYEHQTQEAAKNGQPAPAAAWFKEFEARADGIYGRTEWTGRASQYLAAKEYRYISPTFMHSKDGTVLRVVGAGLTNTPNFDIPAIASQDIGDSMDPTLLLKQIRAALGVPATMADEALATHCQQLTDGAKAVAKLLGLPDTTEPSQLATAAQAAFSALAVTLKVDGAADLPKLATAAQAAVADGGKVDLTKYVPMDVHLATSAQLASLQGQVGQTEVARAVDDAIAAGKLTPALKDWGLAMASQSLTAFNDYVAKAPKLVATDAQQTHTQAPPGNATAGQLNAEELAVASQLGLSPEQFLKTKGVN